MWRVRATAVRWRAWCGRSEDWAEPRLATDVVMAADDAGDGTSDNRLFREPGS